MSFLILQSTYTTVEVGLSNGQKIILPKAESSAQLIPAIQNLLANNSLELKNLEFIAVNQGPGPFTTLRVVIATANGLSFASGVPLVGVDGLHAILENNRDETRVNIVLLNAFGGDVYFGIDAEGARTTGWKNRELLMQELLSTYKDIRFLGSPEDPMAPSLEIVGKLALEKFTQGLKSHELQPLYLKKAVLENKTVKFV